MADKLAGGIRAGSTALSLNFILRKTADNTEQTGKVAADMTAYYWRQGESLVPITLSDLAGITAAWSSGGVKEADATNMPGLYRLDLPNAAIAPGASWVAVSVKVASAYVYFERFNLTTHLWDAPLSEHLVTGSTGEALTAASEAHDMWDTMLPAGYYPGTAGYIVGTNLDTTVSSRLAPTVASRTLDVSAGGEAGVDWANVGSPTTTVTLSGTTVKTATDVETDTQDIQSRLPATLVSGRIDSSVGAMQTDTVTATALAASAVSEIQSGLATSAALATVQADTDDIQTRLPAALVSGRIDAAVGAMAANTVTASALAADAVTEIQSSILTDATPFAGVNINATISSRLAAASYTTPPTAGENADAVWDEQVSQHQQSGSTGEALTAASDASDVWDTQLPAGYYPGTAGAILGNLTAGDAPTAAEVADAVWDEPRADHATNGTFGQGAASVQGNVTGSVASVSGNVGGNVTGSIGSLATQAKADVNAEADTALADVGVTTTVTGRMDAAISTRLAPTTAGRTLDVTAGGTAGVDWANIEAPTTSNALSGTTISTSQAVAAVSGAVGSVTGNVGGNVAGSVASVTAGVTVTTNNDKTGYALTSAERESIAAALLDLSNGVETSLTMRNALRLMAAALAGKLSGAATTTVTIRNAVADSKDRITATVDSSGNRTAVTTDLS